MSDQKKEKKFSLPANVRDLLPAFVTLLVFGGIFTFNSNTFLTPSNMVNVLLQSTTNLIIGVGIFFVIMSGNFDLSGSAILALSTCVACKLSIDGVAAPLCWLAAIGVGALCGAFNGFAVSKMKLVPFIATLSTQYMCRGLALVITNGYTYYGMSDTYIFLGNGSLGFMPMAILISLVLYILIHFILKYTVWGHRLTAVGGNREAAKLAGINTVKVQWQAYIFAGIMYAIAGIVMSGRTQSIMSTSANGAEMYAIAGIIIGGASMGGGRGTAYGVALGIFVVSMLSNGINMMGVGVYWTQFVTGLIIFIAIALDVIRTVVMARKKKMM